MLKNDVLAIFLVSSSDEGGLTLGIAIWYSTTHWRGYSAVSVILLKMLVTGVVSSGVNSLTNLTGKSPGTTEFGLCLHMAVVENCAKNVQKYFRRGQGAPNYPLGVLKFF